MYLLNACMDLMRVLLKIQPVGYKSVSQLYETASILLYHIYQYIIKLF